jgi:hypothetical protein
MPTSAEHNALMRVQRSVAEGTPPDPKDLKKLESLEMAAETLDSLDNPQEAGLRPQKLPPAPQPINSFQTSQPVSPTMSQGLGGQPQSVGGDSGTTRPRKLSAREKDFYEFFDQRFGPLIVLILYVAMADLEKASFYAPSPSECHDMAPHLARVGPKVEDLLRLPKWVHEVAITSDDTFTVGMIMVGYLDRIGVLEKLVPWFTGAASRVRKVNQRETQSNGNFVPVQPEWATNGLYAQPDSDRTVRASDGTERRIPDDISSVHGIGAQWQAD